MFNGLKQAYVAAAAFINGKTTTGKPAAAEKEENPAITQARATLWKGCPRTADVRAAHNAIYLQTIGKAGGLNIASAMAVALRYKRFQEAKKVVSLAESFNKKGRK